MTRPCVVALLVAGALGCGSSPAGPSAAPPTANATPPPTGSTMAYAVPAGAGHGESSFTFTSDNASFGGNTLPDCVPNPSIAGSFCPALQLAVLARTGQRCIFFIGPPVGQSLMVKRYPAAQQLPRDGSAGFSVNCSRGGTACGWSVGAFNLLEFQTNAANVVTRLHIVFEQTCSNNDGTLYGAGTMTGEVWIIDGTKNFSEALF